LNLQGGADDFDRRDDPEPSGVGHLQVQFTRARLRKLRPRGENENSGAQ
jgi:hypothetical protein